MKVNACRGGELGLVACLGHVNYLESNADLFTKLLSLSVVSLLFFVLVIVCPFVDACFVVPSIPVYPYRG